MVSLTCDLSLVSGLHCLSTRTRAFTAPQAHVRLVWAAEPVFLLDVVVPLLVEMKEHVDPKAKSECKDGAVDVTIVCVSQGGRFHEARKTKMETAAGTIIRYR